MIVCRDSGRISIDYLRKTGKEGDSIAESVILLPVLAAGACCDIRENRIPNWWVVVSLISGILLCALESGAAKDGRIFFREGGLFLLRMAAVCAVFFVFFICRMIGAGDIKLAALICGYLGLKAGAEAIGFGFLIGALWSLFILAVKGTFLQRFSCLLAYIRRIYHTKEITAYYCPDSDGTDGVIPLGVCLFFGTAVFLLLGVK